MSPGTWQHTGANVKICSQKSYLVFIRQLVQYKSADQQQ